MRKLLLLTFIVCFFGANAQIVITKGSFPTLCNGTATYYNQLTDIIIAETNPSDFGVGSCGFTVQSVAYTQLNTGIGQVQFALNGDITTGSINVFANQIIQIFFTCPTNTKIDTIRIKGLQIRTLIGAPATFDITKQAGASCTQNGFIVGQSVMTTNTDNNIADFTLPLAQTFCPNAAPYQLVGTPAGGVFSGAGVVAGYFYPTAVNAGLPHSITYTLSNACGTTISKSATIIPFIPTLITNKDSICIGESITFTASGTSASYTFFKNNIAVPSSATKYITTQLNQGDAIHVSSTYSGCTNYSDTISIKVNPKPTVDFTISDYCAGKFSNIFISNASIPYGTSTITGVQWYTDISGTSTYYPSGNSVNHKFLTGGTHTMRSIVTLSNGCSNQKDSTFFMGDYPKAKFKSQSACGSDIINLDDSSYIQQVGSSITQWSWDYENDNTYNQVGVITDHNYDYNAFGDYFIKLKVSTNFGCADSSVKKVSLQPTISPTVSSPYNEEFKLNNGSWAHLGDSTTWNWGAAYGNSLGTGSRKVWATGSIDGTYKNGETSYLQSPCINMVGLDKPMISIKIWSKTQNNNAGAMLEASTDGGLTWNFVGKVGLGSNWYDNNGISGLANVPPAQNHPNNEGWTGMYPDWKIAKISLDKFIGNATVKFRMSFGAVTGNSPRTFGIAIDSVWIGNRTKRVVLEHFTNIENKPYMVNANNAVNLIRDKRNKDVSPVYYHTSFPILDPYNTFYPQVSSNVLYYGITSVPRTILDGNYYTGTDYTSSNDLTRLDTNDVDSRVLETAKFRLDMSTHLTSSQVQALVKIIYTYPYSNYGTDVNLHTIIIDDSANSNNQYSSVVRQMLPDAAGSYISKTWQLNDSEVFSFVWNQAGFTSNKLGVVAYLQNTSTKEILQSVYIRGEGNSGSVVVAGTVNKQLETNDVLIFPNPADNEVTLVTVSDENIENWILYDNLGKEVKFGSQNNTGRGVTFGTSEFSSGVYTIKIKLGNGNSYLKKIVITH